VIRQQEPVYQEVSGVRREIAGSYVLKGRQEVAFEVAAYDATRPLIIDPVLFYSTEPTTSGQELPRQASGGQASSITPGE